MAASRMLISRSVRVLNVEEKAQLVDAAASRRSWFFVVLAMLLAAWAFASVQIQDKSWLLSGFLVIVFLFSIASTTANLRTAISLSSERSNECAAACVWITFDYKTLTYVS
jgi:predicted permease